MRLVDKVKYFSKLTRAYVSISLVTVILHHVCNPHCTGAKTITRAKIKTKILGFLYKKLMNFEQKFYNYKREAHLETIKYSDKEKIALISWIDKHIVLLESISVTIYLFASLPKEDTSDIYSKLIEIKKITEDALYRLKTRKDKEITILELQSEPVKKV